MGPIFELFPKHPQPPVHNDERDPELDQDGMETEEAAPPLIGDGCETTRVTVPSLHLRDENIDEPF